MSLVGADTHQGCENKTTGKNTLPLSKIVTGG
jgi:hypothetical protein